MIFADLLFIYLFLPINLLFYCIRKKTVYKNAVLVIFSLLFYAWGEPIMVFLLIAVAEMNRIFALFTYKHAGTKKSKMSATAAVALTLAILIVFKYNTLLNLPFHPPLPIGISFYSFQVISYTIDVYKGKIKAQQSRLTFFTYVSLYPQLIAGPIVRYNEIENNLSARTTTLEDFSNGINRFTVGLSKKIILANNIGEVASAILETEAAKLSLVSAWLGISLFALQIYYDFSGYSDMAIGLGKIFGFKFPENFNYPYISSSVSEFWRRWHISLGSFFRDYVYIPIGGGRRFYARNILITWVLTGLWHGADWNFALWGLYFGVFIITEKTLRRKFKLKIPRVLGIVTTLVIVVYGWALFCFSDITHFSEYTKALIGINGIYGLDIAARNLLFSNIYIISASVLFCAPICKYAETTFYRFKAIRYLLPVCNAALLIICSVILIGNTHNPFLYYRF